MTWQGVAAMGGVVAWDRLNRRTQAALVAAQLATAEQMLAQEPIPWAAVVRNDGQVYLAMTTEEPDHEK